MARMVCAVLRCEIREERVLILTANGGVVHGGSDRPKDLWMSNLMFERGGTAAVDKRFPFDERSCFRDCERLWYIAGGLVASPEIAIRHFNFMLRML